MKKHKQLYKKGLRKETSHTQSTGLQKVKKVLHEYDVIIKWCFFTLLVLSKIWLVFHHEPWRDETQFLLILRYEGYWNFLQEFKGYQFPMFEFFSNIFYSIAGYTVLNSRIIAIVIASVTSYMILFHLRLPMLISVPLLLGKYMFYEYTVFLNRPYVWGLLLLVTFIALTVNEKPLWIRLLVIGIMIPSHPTLFVLGGSVFAYFLVANASPVPDNYAFWKSLPNLAALLFVFCCIGIGTWALIPGPNTYNTPFEERSLSEMFMLESLLLNQVFFSIANSWWGAYKYFFTTNTGLIVSGWIFIGVSTVLLLLVKPHPSGRHHALAALFGIIVVLGGLSAIFLLKKNAYALGHTSGGRHAGVVYVGVLGFLWLGYHHVRNNFSYRYRVGKFFVPIVVYSFWAVSCYCLVQSAYFQCGADIQRQFTMTAKTAEFLKEKGLDRHIIAVVPDYVTHSIAIHLDTDKARFYRTMSEKTDKINDWSTGFTKFSERYIYEMNNMDRLNLIPPEFIQKNHPLIILNQDAGSTGTIGGVLYQKIAVFNGGIVADEDCYVYDLVRSSVQ